MSGRNFNMPHDWYPDGHEFPHLHNRYGGAAYLEPDYLANHADDQLPLLSTMGRGPQGEGLYVGNIVNTDDTVSFALYSTLTNELVWQSPNMASPKISFESADWRDLVPGVHADLDIKVKRGGVTETHTAYIPAGQPGSIVYLLDETLQRTADDTYTTTISKLTVYGRSQYQSKPTPRPNDIVFFNWRGDDGYGFAFGTIEDVGGTTRVTASSDPVTTSTNVVFTARTFVEVPPITIGQNGHWFVDGVDTGMAARGEKGDKGDKGEQGPRGLKGEKGDKGDTGAAGTNATVRVGATVPLAPGSSAYVTDTDPSESNAVLEFGIPEGKPATIPEVVYTVLDPDEQGSVTIEQISSNANSYRLNIRLPRGEDGKSLDVQHGIWTPYNLPDFDETPINTAFVVDDGDRFIDLYIRGRIAHDAEDGGPWTVIEDLFRYPTDYRELDNAPFYEKVPYAPSEEHSVHIYPSLYGVSYGRSSTGSMVRLTYDAYGRYAGDPGSVVPASQKELFKSDLEKLVRCFLDLGCPEVIDTSQTAYQTVATDIPAKIGTEDILCKVQCAYTSTVNKGISYLIEDQSYPYALLIKLTAPSGVTKFDFSADSSSLGYWEDWNLRVEIKETRSYFDLNTESQEITRVWGSDDDFDIWGNIINKVFATQAEVNAAVDAVIASRS